uniref:uncharacterized protein LOC128929180 n=1 Tax=Callithrix jacchus TaxID=9483 RepID=UPI0023DD4ED3|nr:uncharacterized protein LOC128929180 [Callithrix jacchus]
MVHAEPGEGNPELNFLRRERDLSTGSDAQDRSFCLKARATPPYQQATSSPHVNGINIPHKRGFRGRLAFLLFQLSPWEGAAFSLREDADPGRHFRSRETRPSLAGTLVWISELPELLALRDEDGSSRRSSHILEVKYFLEQVGKAFILHTSQVRSLKSPSARDPPAHLHTRLPDPTPSPLRYSQCCPGGTQEPSLRAGFPFFADRLRVSLGSSIQEPGLFLHLAEEFQAAVAPVPRGFALPRAPAHLSHHWALTALQEQGGAAGAGPRTAGEGQPSGVWATVPEEQRSRRSRHSRPPDAEDPSLLRRSALSRCQLSRPGRQSGGGQSGTRVGGAGLCSVAVGAGAQDPNTSQDWPRQGWRRRRHPGWPQVLSEAPPRGWEEEPQGPAAASRAPHGGRELCVGGCPAPLSPPPCTAMG